jgi:hypothetical protein
MAGTRQIIRREKMNDVILIHICFLFVAMSRLVGLEPIQPHLIYYEYQRLFPRVKVDELRS